MLHLRVYAPSEHSLQVLRILSDEPSVTSLSILRGASLRPPGDVLLADVPRDVANAVLDSLHRAGVSRYGTIQVDPVRSWISRPGLAAEQASPASSADAVVWTDVVQRAYEDSELNWTYATFLTLATLLAGIAIVLDSQILTVGAMVLGPEFGAVAALGLALVRRRPHLFGMAARTLAIGFGAAIAITTLVTLAGRLLGWVSVDDVTGPRPGTAFIYSPDRWSFVVALIAAAAGVLSLTSAKMTGISGVFISVTTVPAAGNVALGLAFGAYSEVWGSTLQLVVNVVGMAAAGWLTLALQQAVWSRLARGRDGVQPDGTATDDRTVGAGG